MRVFVHTCSIEQYESLDTFDTFPVDDVLSELINNGFERISTSNYVSEIPTWEQFIAQETAGIMPLHNHQFNSKDRKL
ncbi:hypothetical protein AKO1_008492 [Acrasis kona]|uniref:Uncharacterized protein n=1 Tax=Acrasis kona TaxID=1008807 RepID=A0AAW2YMD1_9EUKA